MEKQLTLFIDESGTLPDQADRFIVICAVAVKEIKEAENVINRVLDSLRQTRDSLKLKELKYYHSRDAVKRIFLAAIVAAGLEIFVLAVDKKGRKIPDKPENFAILLSELLSEVFLWYGSKKLDIIIDKHFSRNKDQEEFNKILKQNISYGTQWRLENIHHVDSQSNLSVNIADMCAGAVLWKYSRGKDQFYNMVKDSILTEKITNWPEIKRKDLSKNKNSPEPA
jgi:hypothetical protein